VGQLDPERMRKIRDVEPHGTPEEKKQLQKESNSSNASISWTARGLVAQPHGQRSRPLQEKMTSSAWPFCDKRGKGPQRLFHVGGKSGCPSPRHRQLAATAAGGGQDPAMLVWLDQAQSNKTTSERKILRAR